MNRRIAADNIFGMTYAEARRKADDSQSGVDKNKGDTLKLQSTLYKPSLLG